VVNSKNPDGVKSIMDFQKIEESLNHLTTQKPLLKQGIDLIINELRTNFNLINEKLENSNCRVVYYL
jgi:hypothetical protein